MTSFSTSGFGLQNLPVGVYSLKSGSPKSVTFALGDFVVDLVALEKAGLFGIDLKNSLNQDTANQYIALGKSIHHQVRASIRQLFEDTCHPLRDLVTQVLIPLASVDLHLPIAIGDYTDFYSSEDHATNVGKMFRDPANALLPNWKHLPVGYHGRSSSIVVSGTPIRRPWGQMFPKGAECPVFGPSKRMDFELEMAFVIGKDSTLGQPISTQEAEDYIFGLMLFNDWSARDIQQWEYVPLGPFLGKNFGSSVSPWIVPLEALQNCRVSGKPQDPPVFPYLMETTKNHLDIELEVEITTQSGEKALLSKSNTKHLYWSMHQQLAHHTINGCNVRVGDLMASGTISGPTPDSFGSLLELSWGGQNPIQISTDTLRTFLEDGDTITMRATAYTPEGKIEFGEVKSTLLPALESL